METTNEIWKNIPGYENYRVSSIGRVRSDYIISGRWNKLVRRKYPMILRQDISHDGYLRVSLSKNGKPKHFMVHRLVAMAFIPNPDNLPEINHKDENTQNNVVSNLEWCTRKHNANYGTLPQRESEWGLNHPAKSIPVQQLYEGEVIAEFPSINEAVRQTGISEKGIGRCCMGKQETSGGFKWRYKN